MDPLVDAPARAAALEAACPGYVSVQMLEAGHCPHDERPDLVNAGIVKFVEEKVMFEKKSRQLLRATS